MVSIGIDQDSLTKFKQRFAELGSNLTKEMRVAVNKTAKQVKIQAARKLREELKAPVKVLKKAVQVSRKANASELSAELLLLGGYPIPLRYFSPRQNKRGVAVKVNPKLAKTTVAGAFLVRRYRGNVFTRTGQKRGPLTTQKGPAPGDVYEKAGITALAVKVAREQLQKQANERVRFLTLKAEGKLRGNQK